MALVGETGFPCDPLARSNLRPIELVAPAPIGPCSETPAKAIASHQIFCSNAFSMTSLATLISRG
jgi:hypothetical protein